MQNGNLSQSTVSPAWQGSPPPKKKGKGPWRVVFWLALILLIVSLIALGVVVYSYWNGQQTYKNVAEEAAVDTSGTTLADMKVDWDALREMNPEVVGWIYVPDTVINYPIAQASDDDKYLTVDFLGGRGQITHFGTIFLAAENTSDFSDKNNVIYGHNMNDGSMFSAFAGFLNDDVFNSHRTIYLLTPDGNYRLETFSILVCEAYDPLGQTVFANDVEFEAYVQDKINRNQVNALPPGRVAADIDRTFAMVTCTSSYEDTRVVTFAYAVESTVANSGSNNVLESINDRDVQDVGNAVDSTRVS